MRTVIGLLMAVIVSVISSLSTTAHARQVTDGEKVWAAALRACMERKKIPRNSVEFRLVDHVLVVFYKTTVPHELREECEKEAQGKSEPPGKKTDL